MEHIYKEAPEISSHSVIHEQQNYMPIKKIKVGRLTSVLNLLSTLKEFDSWVTSDPMLLGQLTFLSGVNFGQSDRRTFLLQLLGSLGVLGGQSLAMSAPGGI